MGKYIACQNLNLFLEYMIWLMDKGLKMEQSGKKSQLLHFLSKITFYEVLLLSFGIKKGCFQYKSKKRRMLCVDNIDTR